MPWTSLFVWQQGIFDMHYPIIHTPPLKYQSWSTGWKGNCPMMNPLSRFEPVTEAPRTRAVRNVRNLAHEYLCTVQYTETILYFNLLSIFSIIIFSQTLGWRVKGACSGRLHQAPSFGYDRVSKNATSSDPASRQSSLSTSIFLSLLDLSLLFDTDFNNLLFLNPNYKPTHVRVENIDGPRPNACQTNVLVAAVGTPNDIKEEIVLFEVVLPIMVS